MDIYVIVMFIQIAVGVDKAGARGGEQIDNEMQLKEFVCANVRLAHAKVRHHSSSISIPDAPSIRVRGHIIDHARNNM